MAVSVPNPEQRAAIEARGNVFLSAGAGTGKTSVLVERFAGAVCDEGIDIDSSLVITYTKRAAGELRARIREALRERGRHDLARALDSAWISTIHGFCNRLLKTYPFEAGLDPRFRELDEAQAAVVRGEAFDEALERFCAGDDPERLRLLATYRADGLRRMLIGVYETLRAAGRPLVLELGERPALQERVDELREAASCLADDERATDLARANAARLLDVVTGDPLPERLLDLTPHRAQGERAASYEEARQGVEQAALDELAAHDRDLLQLLLDAFAGAYASAKARESALDFEDLQLVARDLLREHPEIRAKEQLRFRAASSASSSICSRNMLTSSSSGTSSSPSTASGTRTWRSSASDARPRAEGSRWPVTTGPGRRCSPPSTTSSAASSARASSRSPRRVSFPTPSSDTRSSCS
jgi:ATP-dependent helicase/nuclease subunit A